MYEKIIGDLQDTAEELECSECPVRDCPNYMESDREACLFNLAANIIGCLSLERTALERQDTENERMCNK